MKGKTKDEKYLACLYEEAFLGRDFGQPFDKYEIGRKAGIQPKAVDAICKLLVQANFIRKSGQDQVSLTRNGENLARDILEA